MSGKKKPANQIIDLAKQCVTMVNLDPVTAGEAKGDVTDKLIEIIQIATRIDARSGTAGPSRKRKAATSP